MVLFARDVVEKEFLSLPKETTAVEAAKLMKHQRQGFAVVKSGNESVGMVTEWDYLSKLVAEGKDPSTVTIGELMTTGIQTVQGSEGLETVAKLMADKMIRRIIVVQDGKVIGVITASTILARMKEYVDRISTTIARLQTPAF